MKHRQTFENICEAAKQGQQFEPAQPSEPVDLAPGSPEKIEVLRFRVENGLELFHPGDRADFMVSRSSYAAILGYSAGDNPNFFRKPE